MLVVLVAAAPPDARLVASLGGAVEPLVHAPEAIQSASITGIGVVDTLSSSVNALMPGLSRLYVAASVPHVAANRDV